MSLCDGRGLFATDKEMARRRSRSCVEGHCRNQSQIGAGQRADELISVSLIKYPNTIIQLFKSSTNSIMFHFNYKIVAINFTLL